MFYESDRGRSDREKISLEIYIEAISAPINMIEAKITMPSWETFLYQGFYWEQL